jgi:hypothetical protein
MVYCRELCAIISLCWLLLTVSAPLYRTKQDRRRRVFALKIYSANEVELFRLTVVNNHVNVIKFCVSIIVCCEQLVLKSLLYAQLVSISDFFMLNLVHDLKLAADIQIIDYFHCLLNMK